MTRRFAATLCALGAAAALGGQASAHHSFSMFDINREMTLEGTVKAFEWASPHSWVELMVKDAKGREVEWSIESSSPNNLTRFGWRRSSIKVGDHALAVIHPLKDGQVGGSLVKITVNGQVIGAPKPS
jgi:hypothetical protein